MGIRMVKYKAILFFVMLSNAASFYAMQQTITDSHAKHIEWSADDIAFLTQKTILAKLERLETTFNQNPTSMLFEVIADTELHDPRIIRLLLSEGADRQAISPEGKTAYELAIHYKTNKAIRSLLQIQPSQIQIFYTQIKPYLTKEVKYAGCAMAILAASIFLKKWL